MGKIVKMAAKEIDKEFTPAKIRAMLAKSKKLTVSEDEIPFTPEEWWEKAEYPNRGRPDFRNMQKKASLPDCYNFSGGLNKWWRRGCLETGVNLDLLTTTVPVPYTEIGIFFLLF